MREETHERMICRATSPSPTGTLDQLAAREPDRDVAVEQEGEADECGLLVRLRDPRPGGTFRVEANGLDVVLGEYVEVQPPHRVVFTWGFEGSETIAAAGSTRVEVTLEPDGDGTRLTLLHHGLPERVRDAHAEGWTHYLARLAPAAAGDAPEPDPWIVNDQKQRSAPCRPSTFRTTVDAPPEDFYAALATEEGQAGNWTDQLEVPEETGGIVRFGFGPDWAKTLELRIETLEPGRRVEWTPVGGFPGWIGTSIAWELELAEDGGTAVHFTHDGWADLAADGEMAMCGYTWAMIIDRLGDQVARGERAPYFTAGAPLPR